MSAFRESNQPDAKLSMTRIVMFGLLVLAFVEVILGRDAMTVNGTIGGGVIAALSKAWEVTAVNKECAPTK